MHREDAPRVVGGNEIAFLDALVLSLDHVTAGADYTPSPTTNPVLLLKCHLPQSGHL